MNIDFLVILEVKICSVFNLFKYYEIYEKIKILVLNYLQ